MHSLRDCSAVARGMPGTFHASVVDMTFKKILCAVDFSDSSREALRAAAELARTSQATLVLVHVWQAPLWATDYGMHLPNDALLKVQATEESKLASWRSEAQQLGAPEVVSKLLRGIPWDEIVGTARDDRAIDLIILGMHGRTDLRSALIGSVAERVVRHAPCTVMVMGRREPDA